jgi:hypothetical protein
MIITVLIILVGLYGRVAEAQTWKPILSSTKVPCQNKIKQAGLSRATLEIYSRMFYGFPL